jgi:hypothetical protein
MSEMKHISQVPAGYLVRKTVNGKHYQRFFSDSKYGDNRSALQAAQSYRDELLDEVRGKRSFQSHNVRNITGIVGVAWHLRHNSHRDDAVVHCFRGQMAGKDGKHLSRAWSVQRYGLWHAYDQAARWRYMVAFGKAMKASEIISNFLVFLDNYFVEMDEKPEGLRSEMRDSLVDLSIDRSIPKEIISALPRDIQRRFESKRRKLQVVGGSDASAEKFSPLTSGKPIDPLGLYSEGEQEKIKGS